MYIDVDQKQGRRLLIPCLLLPLTTLNGPDRAKEGFDRPLYEQELAIKSFNETVEEFRVTADSFVFRV